MNDSVSRVWRFLTSGSVARRVNGNEIWTMRFSLGINSMSVLAS